MILTSSLSRVEDRAAVQRQAPADPDVPPLPAAGANLRNGRELVALALLCLAFLLPGLVGHDPWKQDETYVFGIIHHMLQSGDYVVPKLAGEPFMEKPPLYYLTAVGFVHLFERWLPQHDAARLTSGFYTVITLLFVGLAARELWGRGYGRRAVLLLTGCLGLIRFSHEMITDVPLLAGFAMAFYGLILARRRPVLAGLLVGTGTGAGFLAKGLIGPGLIGLIAVLLPLVGRSWRRSDYPGCLVISFFTMLPWLLIWPWELYQQSPTDFMQWLWLNNLGRFLGYARLGAEKTEPWYYLHAVFWLTWPALPLAGLTLWRQGRAGLQQPAVQISVLAVIVILVVLNGAEVARDVYALPLLVPLALLGARTCTALPARLDRVLFRFDTLLFGVLALLVWGIWVDMQVTGSVPTLPLLSRYLPADFRPHFAWLPFCAALLLTLLWSLALWRSRVTAGGAVLSWTLGLILVWGLLGTLWLPWIDAARSFRGMSQALARVLPASYDCIQSRYLGESQRGMLDYFDGIITRRMETDPHARCQFLLIQANGDAPSPQPGATWHLRWEGSRDGDTTERHYLFQRINLAEKE